jgi:hypothetical protein
MKNIFKNSIKLLIAFFGCASLLVSCEYQDVADADYPAPKLYMPAALNGIFTIDDIPRRVDFLPTPGMAYRFKIDVANNKLIVPLGVYRSGLDRSDNVTADISVNADTVTNLIVASMVPDGTFIIPSSNYSMPPSIDVPSGADVADFNLEIDLNYLHSFADTVLALGVGISSSQIEVNPMYATTIVLIYTKILNPFADFSANIDATDKSKVTFTNNSIYAMRYLWDFGDGATDTVKTPVHIFASPDTYNVKLTAVGVLGTSNQSVMTVPVTIEP